MGDEFMIKKLSYIVFALLLTKLAFATYPPTSTLGFGDSSPVTTFSFEFPFFNITHTGSTATMASFEDPLYAQISTPANPAASFDKCYVKSNDKFYCLNSSGVESLIGPAAATPGAWLLAGNASTSPGTDFLGTTDAQDLVLKTNGTERFRLTSSGSYDTTFSTGLLHSNSSGILSSSAVDLASADVTGVLPFANMSSPQVTKWLYVDGGRTDSYTQDGTTFRPYKTIQAAINAAVSGSYNIEVGPGTYAENLTFNALTFNSIQLLGHKATIAPATGNAVDSSSNNGNLSILIFDGFTFLKPINIVGSGSSGLCGGTCYFRNSAIQANVTVQGILGEVDFERDYMTGNVIGTNVFEMDFRDGTGLGGTLTLVNTFSQLESFLVVGTSTVDAASTLVLHRGTFFGASGNTLTINGVFAAYNSFVRSNIVLNSGSTFFNGESSWGGTFTLNAGATYTNRETNGLSALGDVIYGAAQGVRTILAGNTTSTKKFLTQTGTGTVSAAPAWGVLASGDIPSLSSLYCALTGCTMTGAINMGSHLINSVTNPVSAQDAATKNYVDTGLAQLNPAASVYAATPGSGITGTYTNLGCIGDTFLVTATGALSIDGVSPPLGSRVLLKDQSSGFQNGVYSVTIAGSVGVQPLLTRALDYDTPTDMNSGQIIPVINGTVNAGSSWINVATITTCGSDNLSFTQFTRPPSSYASSTLTSAHLFVGNGSNVATDVAASGDLGLSNAGVFTFNTVNSNVGSFGSSTSIPSLTVNGKGLITAASGNAVVAPAATLSGTTLNSTVVSSSLTSVGTIASGTWNGTAVDVPHGGTGLATLTANNVILGNGASSPTFVAPGTSGNVLTSNGTTWTSAASSAGATGFYGSVNTPQTANCSWTRSSPTSTFANFSADGDCPVATATGNASAPGTKIPAITFVSLPAGNYLFVITGRFALSGASAPEACSFTLNDGTVSFGDTIVQDDATNDKYGAGFSAYVNYASPQSNITIQFQSKASQASPGDCFIDAGTTAKSTVFTITVFKL